jgi:rod shape determining protein RodA
MATTISTRPGSTGRSSSWTSARSTPSGPRQPRLRVDYTLLLMTAGLCAAGVLAVYSTRYRFAIDTGFDPWYYAKRQAMFMVIGAVAMFAIMMIDYRRMRAWVPRLFAGTCGMLALLPFLGTETNQAKAWYKIGSFTLQPSEFAKITLVLMLATVVANDRDGPLSYARFVVSLLVLGLPVGLIMLQPDLGTASTFVVIAMGVLLVGRARVPHILLISVLSIVSVVALWKSGAVADYQIARVTSFIKPQPVSTKGLPPAEQQLQAKVNQVRDQVRYSQQAVRLGGVRGQGFANGPTMNGDFVHEQRTDFIFATVAEQYGLVGMAVLLGLYLLVLFRLLRVAHLASDGFGALIASGSAAVLAWHTFENVGMNMGIMPVTGIPLPLVSYGGSSTIAFMMMFGFVQNVYRHREAKA